MWCRVILHPVFTVWLGIDWEYKSRLPRSGFLPTMLATAAGIQTSIRNCCSPRAAWARR